MRVLSLDISTTTIGIAVCSDQDKLTTEHLTYYKPSAKLSGLDKLLETKSDIMSIASKLSFDQIAIEDIAEHMAHASNSKTIISLAVMNRTVALALLERFKIHPKFYNVNSIRAGIKPKGYAGKLSKEDVPMAIEQLTGSSFLWEYKKEKKTKENYDMADAAAVGLFHLKQCAILTDKKST